MERITLDAWSIYDFEEPQGKQQVLTQTIWFNSFISKNKQVVFYRDRYDKGVKTVSDEIVQNGSVVSYQEFLQKYPEISTNFIAYTGLISGVPTKWRQLLKTPRVDVEIKPKVEQLISMEKVCKGTYTIILEKSVAKNNLTGINKWEDILLTYIYKGGYTIQ